MNSASLGMFDNYCASSDRDSSDSCYPQPPALFNSLSISTEFPRFEEYFHPGFSPSTSGRSSPVGGSPASSFGELEDLPWNQTLSAHSSPAPSPSSLSPLTTAFDGFALDEGYPAAEHSVLSGPPAFSRLRSSSHSVSSAPTTELWSEGVGRGRSASFSGATDTQFYAKTYSDNTDVQISVADIDGTMSESLGTGMAWGEADMCNTIGDHPPGTLVPGWRYPGRDGPTADPQDLAPPSPSLLTVPPLSGLRRRPACSSRRTLSHSDVHSLMPPEQEPGRGRGQHRTTLSIPNSRSSSRDVSPHSALHFNESYPLSVPSSPAFEDAKLEDADGAISIGRRHTLTAVRGAGECLPATAPLMRAISAPTRAPRSRAMDASHGLGVFKAEAGDAPFLSGEAPGSRQEFRVAQVPSPYDFKAEVASNKIRKASSARRINAAAFECPLPTCNSTFTARHNLINHINSHNKYRPYKCACGMTFTTQGVLNRHKKRCRK